MKRMERTPKKIQRAILRPVYFFSCRICSVDTNFEQEAALAIDLIRKRIHEPSLPPQRITLPVSLVCRGTCGGAEQN